MSTDTATGGYGGGSISDAFYPLYKLLFDGSDDFTDSVERKLAQARMPHTVEMYLSRALAVGALVGLLLWLVGTLGVFMIFELFVEGTPTLLGLPLEGQTLALVNAVKIPALIAVGGVVFGAVGFGAGFGSLLAVPYFKAGERKREINVLLSDATSFMYALSVGGLNQLEILEAIAAADDTYGEVSKEFQAIIRETQYFDTDYRTAIRNQAMRTPSDELSQFLTDMLSIVDSGGNMTNFLEDQKDKQMRTSKQEQETVLETLELFGEMFMTLSLFPLLLIIILVIMSMMGQAQTMLLYATVYILIPVVGGAFLVMISTVVQDEIGDGYLRPEGETESGAEGLFSLGLVERYTGEHSVFDRIKSREGTYETAEMLKRPHLFFRDHPLTVLFITLPATLVLLAFAVLGGWAPLDWEVMKANPVRGTFFWLYLPLYVNCIPLAVFHEWNVHRRQSIVGKLSENLRKLASANETGMTLLESINTVSETSTGKLADEFEVIHAKVKYGTSLKDALYEFNNKYHIPRLARTTKLIAKAQEASSQITAVLSTAAQASENQDDIARDRKSRTRMQVVIIVMTFMTLLGVMAILKMRFLSVMVDLAAQTGGGGGEAAEAASGGGVGGGGLAENVDTDLLNLLFFHAVTFQALVSGFVAGYIRDVSILAGVKYLVVLPTFSLLVFMVI
jgi:flagellar protein FlaJ